MFYACFFVFCFFNGNLPDLNEVNVRENLYFERKKIKKTEIVLLKMILLYSYNTWYNIRKTLWLWMTNLFHL